MSDLNKIWKSHYQIAPQQLQKAADIDNIATAFNTNIDAVVKISGKQLSTLAKQFAINAADIENNQTCCITKPCDAIRGICKCFTQGIAEEWLIKTPEVADWLLQNLGYERMAMGGQAGIIANVAAALKVQRVIVHTASHPGKQAEQFLSYDNLLGFDENGNLQKAAQIDRSNDTPLVHQIFEFAKDDVLELETKSFTCPKANRFIASYDPANLALVLNEHFVRHINDNGYEYLILSGFHNLTVENEGLKRLDEVAQLLGKWRPKWPQGIIHLELASTQDKIIRREIVEKIAPLADSVGFNDREAIDVIEVIDASDFEKIKNKTYSAADLFAMMLKIKAKTKTPRLQLHMFGLYLTLQDKNFRITPQQNKLGMLLAAVAAASKAGWGQINKTEDFLWALNNDGAVFDFSALQNLSECINAPMLVENGIAELADFDIIAVPTLIIPKPKTLVGMGDTISAVSLFGAR